MSKFHVIWTSKIEKSAALADYSQAKLAELTNAFYTLKISHDQMEKNYIFKSINLRNCFLEIKETFYSKKDSYKFFIQLLSKSFEVKSSEILLVNKNRFYKVEDEKYLSEIKNDDLLIQLVLKKKNAEYVSSLSTSTNATKYIAVIPAIHNGEIKALLLIKEM